MLWGVEIVLGSKIECAVAVAYIGSLWGVLTCCDPHFGVTRRKTEIMCVVQLSGCCVGGVVKEF